MASLKPGEKTYKPGDWEKPFNTGIVDMFAVKFAGLP